MRMRDATEQAARGVSEARGAEWIPRQFWHSPEPLSARMAAATAPPSEAIPAYVNEGRWVVSCPDCAGAQFACRTDPRFMCVECANVVVGGLWRPVVWPKDTAAIEDELGERSMGRHRNWVPGETVQNLRDERKSHEHERG